MSTKLVFKSVTYKNFLATGNKAVTIALNENPTTLIYGKNGSGKSTTYEALYFGLYGKAFRKSNIPELINNINNKNMCVEVEFSSSDNEFKVVRGRKPTIFEIWCNGKLVDQNASSYDYQAHLEKNILKMSPATFMQTVLLGSLHYVPYMRINRTKDRMAIIEELLDIQIFSQMHFCTRTRFNSIKRDLEIMEQKYELLTNSISLTESHISQMEAKTDEIKEGIKNDIQSLEDKRKELETKLETLKDEKSKIDVSSKTKYQAQKDNWNRLNTLAEKELKDLNSDIEFFRKSDSCNRCHQDIDSDFKEKEIKKIESRKNKVLKARETKIKTGLEETIKNLEYLNILSQKLIDLNSEIVETNSVIDTTEANLEKLRNSLSAKGDNAHISEKRKELGKYKGQLTKLIKKRSTLEREAKEYDFISKLLHDDGIKKNIIKMYIPIINKLISKYLSILGFPIKFTFDENFKETIIVKGRRDLTYSNFSAGEKIRVDLALLFAFREIPIIRSGNSCNLLIFDEIADSAMDVDGWDSFLTIINSISDIGNVFVISPRGDALVDKFTKTIRFQKTGAFSEIDTNDE